MVNTTGRISDDTAATVLTGADFAAVQSGANVKVPIALFDAAYQPLDADLTAIAALTTATYGRSLLEAASASAARTLLGSVIGTDVQAYSADLTAIAALAKTDGNIIVGDGSSWVAESGATARTSLGLGTGDSPQFTGIELGHATDTTIARSGAGDITIEGNAVYRAGGTDVAVADGGTGASTAADAFTALKQAASDTDTGVLEIAVQSEMEAGSSATLAVTPGRQHYHPSAAKFWAHVTVSGGTPTLAASYNVTSITDDGVGQLTVTIATDFSSGSAAILLSAQTGGISSSLSSFSANGAGSVQGVVYNLSNALIDPNNWSFSGFGDQ